MACDLVSPQASLNIAPTAASLNESAGNAYQSKEPIVGRDRPLRMRTGGALALRNHRKPDGRQRETCQF